MKWTGNSCPFHSTVLKSPRSHFVRTPALCLATESTPKTSKSWGYTLQCHGALTGRGTHSYHYSAREHSLHQSTKEHPNTTALRSTHRQRAEEQPDLTVLGQNNKDKGFLEMSMQSMHDVNIECSHTEAAWNREMMLITHFTEHLLCTWHCGRGQTP